MSNTTDREGTGPMDEVGQLIRHAGARDEVPAVRLERSRECVRAHWEREVQERNRRRPSPRVYAIAAGWVAVIGVAMVLAMRWPAQELQAVASIERVIGEIQINGQIAGLGRNLGQGATISTGSNDRVALRLAGGQSIRIDTNSHLVLNSAHELTLESGAVYVDTHTTKQDDPIKVITSLGTAQDIGTQFQVRMVAPALIVGVRDGLVEVGTIHGAAHEVNAGYRVAFRAGSGPETSELDTTDPSWQWIESVAPTFDIDGSSLMEYLAWYANEGGLELVWADQSSRLKAGRITLTGSIEGVSRREGLDVVRQVAPFEYRHTQDARLWVRVP